MKDSGGACAGMMMTWLISAVVYCYDSDKNAPICELFNKQDQESGFSSFCKAFPRIHFGEKSKIRLWRWKNSCASVILKALLSVH